MMIRVIVPAYSCTCIDEAMADETTRECASRSPTRRRTRISLLRPAPLPLKGEKAWAIMPRDRLDERLDVWPLLDR